MSVCTGIFLFNEKDRLVYDTAITPPSELPLVFCLCKKRETANMNKNYSDIKHLTSKADFYFLSDKLDLMTEDKEFIDEVFKNKVNIYMNFLLSLSQQSIRRLKIILTLSTSQTPNPLPQNLTQCFYLSI